MPAEQVIPDLCTLKQAPAISICLQQSLVAGTVFVPVHWMYCSLLTVTAALSGDVAWSSQLTPEGGQAGAERSAGGGARSEASGRVRAFHGRGNAISGRTPAGGQVGGRGGVQG